MKRLALLLAAAAVGTACGTNCPTGTTLVSWSGFDGPTGGVNQPCGVAGVASVDLWLDNQFVGNWPCTDYGAGVPGVPRGGNVLTVEGIATDGATILFRDELAYTQPGCGNVGLQAFPAAGTVDLNYSFESGTSCTSGSSYIWFTLFDVVANATDPGSVDATHSPRRFPCGPTDPVVALPVGQFDLDAITEMTETSPSVFAQTAHGCKLPLTFNVASRAQTVVNPSLADTGVACLP